MPLLPPQPLKACRLSSALAQRPRGEALPQERLAPAANLDIPPGARLADQERLFRTVH